MSEQCRARVRVNERSRNTSGRPSPHRAPYIISTLQFLHHLRFLLRDLTALPRLPELETTIKNYFILKPCPSIEAEDTERADALVQSPEVFLSRLPEDDNLARRLFRGSVEGNDQVIKRLCTLLFSWMRTDFNSKFHSKGRGEPLARYLNLDKSKTCSDLAYTGCQLQPLYDKSPALLLATIKSSLYESVIPRLAIAVANHADAALKDIYRRTSCELKTPPGELRHQETNWKRTPIMSNRPSRPSSKNVQRG